MLVPRLIRWIEAGPRPSLHALATDPLARASSGPLPRARELEGTFARRSGPNCFGLVMAATGEPVDDEWVVTDTFTAWLDEHTRPISRGTGEPGEVLVWREHGTVAHAAVSLGGGWTLQKPSQSWSSPVVVWPTSEVVNSWRLPGTQLSRHVLV